MNVKNYKYVFTLCFFFSLEHQAFINLHKTKIYIFIANYLGRIFFIEFVVGSESKS